ncbi:MAG TPA: hypothetical protein VFH27_13460, partial [Longimicrobiaceae bacterium]|nr:hypothetical protein [Longimicrobiaceae bacterium]
DAVEPVHAVQAPSAAGTILCSRCCTELRSVYHEVDGKVHCTSCRERAEARIAEAMAQAGGLGRGMLFGLGGAIAGAAAYYAVMAATGLVVGYVAVLVGFLVGAGVRKGAGGRAGRKYQVVAVVLTYLAIASAYVPDAVKEIRGDKAETAASASPDGAAASNPVSAATGSASDAAAPLATGSAVSGDAAATKAPAGAAASEPASHDLTVGEGLLGLGAILLLVAALPILVGIGSPISLFVMAIGIYQAWKIAGSPAEGVITRAPSITGPHRVPAPVEA